MELDELLRRVPEGSAREDFLRASRRVFEESGGPGDGGDTAASRTASLAEVRRHVRLALRAARHPVPTDEELRRMITRYFADDQ
jgi:hypothetical protein